MLLRWFAPPVTPRYQAQLLTTALWYKAVALHPSRGFWARYGEWLLDVLGGYGTLLAWIAVAYLWLNATGSELDWLLHCALLLLCLPLALLGLSVIRFAARRQALLDYFRTWRLDADVPAVAAACCRRSWAAEPPLPLQCGGMLPPSAAG